MLPGHPAAALCSEDPAPPPLPSTPVLQHSTDRVDAGVDQHYPGLGPE